MLGGLPANKSESRSNGQRFLGGSLNRVAHDVSDAQRAQFLCRRHNIFVSEALLHTVHHWAPLTVATPVARRRKVSAPAGLRIEQLEEGEDHDKFKRQGRRRPDDKTGPKLQV